MKKTLFLSIFFICWSFATNAQSSLSINYLYLGKRGKYFPEISKELVNHGVGFQSKILLRNRFYLMPDIGYFFTDYEKVLASPESYHNKSYRENKVRYYAANANLTYAFPLLNFFSILPFAGVGYFHEFAWAHSHIEWQIQDGANYDITEKDNAVSLVCNMGFNLEWSFRKNIFFTTGLKYMLDIYDMKYNAFPNINAGIGYSF